MQFWEGDNLTKNLETLSKLKVGEKIGFDHAKGRLERNGFGQGLIREKQAESQQSMQFLGQMMQGGAHK